jgi:hypothetical protein
MYKLSIALFIAATIPAFARERAALGSCWAAVQIAKAHHNVWQEPAFTPEECAIVVGKAIDAGVLDGGRTGSDDNGSSTPPNE